MTTSTAFEREAAESLFRATLESLPDALLLVRACDGTCAFANRSAGALLGFRTLDLVDRRVGELLTSAADSADALGLIHGEASLEWSGAWVVRKADGSQLPIRITSTPLADLDAVLLRLESLSAVIGTSQSAQDVPDGHRASERLALLTAASTVLTSTSDYVAALDELARLALPTLGSACLVHVVDVDGELMQIVAVHQDAAMTHALSSLPGHSQEVLDLPRKALDSGTVAIYYGTNNESSGNRLLPAMSGCSVPIRLRGEMLGTLTFLTDDLSRSYDADDAALGQELGRRMAQAMDSARLLEREQRRRRQLDAVREVAAELTNELDLSRLLDLIIRRVAQIADDSTGILYIWDEPSQLLIPRSTHRGGRLPLPQPLQLGEGITGIAALERRTVVVNDYQHWEDALPRLIDRLVLGSALSTPVMYQSQLVGVITLSREVGNVGFTNGQQDLVQLFADHAAVAIEHARLFEREQERLRQLEALREISTEITRELDLPNVLNIIWQRAAALFQGDRGALFFWDEDTQEIRPVAWPAAAAGLDGMRLKPGVGIVGKVVQVRRGIVVNGPREWPEPLPSYQKGGPAVSFMAEPILYQDRLIGVIGIGRTKPGQPFTDRDQEMLRLFGQHAAVAIENARLFEQEQKRRRQVEAIRDIAAEIARELDLARVLQLTFERAIDLIPGSFGWVYLWDEATETLVPSATTVPLARDFTRRRNLGEGASGIAAARREGVIVNNYPEWEHALPRAGALFYAQAALAAPILYQDRLVGVITIIRVDEGDPFSQDELALLSLFADHAAIAIENARLYQRELRERRQLEAIRDLTSDIIRELDIETVLKLTIERARALANCQTSVIFEWDEANHGLRRRIALGFKESDPHRMIKLGQGMSGRVARSRKGDFENDYPRFPRRLGYVMEQVDMQAVMSAPIVFNERLIGVITVGRTTNDEPFSGEDLEFLCLFADHAAIAIENARLYAELSDRAQQMKTLVGKLLRAQDEERRRVAYEVHDSLAQVAAATHQHLEAFAACNRPRTEMGRHELDAARQTAQQTVREARRVIAGLRPTVLDDLGLASALRQEMEALKANGYVVTYEENLGSRRFAQEVETTLFSIGREALTNVRKHAGATRVEMRLSLQVNSIELDIQDWGRGFDTTKARQRIDDRERIGLRGMEERVSWMGGQLTIKSRRGKGSRVAVTVPLEPSTQGKRL